ncbi:hypothetical protein HETIRDRAFT_116021 [Heterobasidion irregulare TC 32-1]|uniref:Uncharacterized protein n=1 Tax=Heterobasidion irregulare (strain TC 32-1) TaxID=747525 RepID=W4K517_HETIT|nr:uncharacterized protein HETIRDRAFT_116021 [Heterobasidion irregulare TC 32-1]ETW80902.1 hypothetical protein HETIRDRAFT_116021 [Heterobasidion irregulare TC 32-1]
MLPSGVGVSASYEAGAGGTARPRRSTSEAAARSKAKFSVAAQHSSTAGSPSAPRAMPPACATDRSTGSRACDGVAAWRGTGDLGRVRGQVCEGAGAGQWDRKAEAVGEGPAGWRGQGPMGRVPRSSRGGVGKCRGWAGCVSGGASAAGRGPSAGVRRWDGSVEESDREAGRLLDRSGGVARSNGFVRGDRDA